MSRNTIIKLITPLLLLLIASAVIVLAAIKPYNRASVFLNIVFTDGRKLDPNDSGLEIKDNTIITDYSGTVSETGEPIYPSFGEKFALLQSDRLALSIPVYWGSKNELFKIGACQATNSVLPGRDGNSVISAHADTYFADLNRLEVGDEITIYTNYGKFTYRVKETVVFRNTNKKYIIPTEDTRLTLYTCKMNLMSSSERIGVICEPVERQFYTEGN